MTDAEYEKLVEAAGVAYLSVDEPDLSEGLRVQYGLFAALDAIGYRDDMTRYRELREAAEGLMEIEGLDGPRSTALRAALTQEEDT